MNQRKSMIKRICLSILFHVCVVISAFASFNVGDFEAESDGNGRGTIVGYNGAAEEITIPSVLSEGSINTSYISSLGNNSTVKRIIIPQMKDLQSIEQNAFSGFTALEEIDARYITDYNMFSPLIESTYSKTIKLTVSDNIISMFSQNSDIGNEHVGLYKTDGTFWAGVEYTVDPPMIVLIENYEATNGLIYSGDVIGVKVVGYDGRTNSVTVPATIQYGSYSSVPVVGVESFGGSLELSEISFSSNEMISDPSFELGANMFAGMSNLKNINLSNLPLEKFKDVVFPSHIDYILASGEDVAAYESGTIVFASKSGYTFVLSSAPNYAPEPSGTYYFDENALYTLTKNIRHGVYTEGEKYTFILDGDNTLSDWNIDCSLVLKSGWTLFGQGHHVNMQNASAPLIYSIAEGATVSNIIVSGSMGIDAETKTGSQEGVEPNIAFITGENNGLIDMCLLINTTITMESPSREFCVGQIAGSNKGTITDCAVINSKAEFGGIADRLTYGTFCGSNESTITDSYYYNNGETMLTVDVANELFPPTLGSVIGRNTAADNMIKGIYGSGMKFAITGLETPSVNSNHQTIPKDGKAFFKDDVYGDEFISHVTYKSKWCYSSDVSRPEYGFAVPSGVLDPVEEEPVVTEKEIILDRASLAKLSRRIKYGIYDEEREYIFKLSEDITISESTDDYGTSSGEDNGQMTWGAQNSFVLKPGWTFDGQGHTINLVGTSSAICDSVAEGATFKNLLVKGVTSETGLKWCKRSAWGCSAMVRVNAGTVRNCAANYMLYVDNSYENGAESSVGALVGANGSQNSYENAKIQNCAVAGQQIFLIGSADNQGRIGGWAGKNLGSINDGYSEVEMVLEGGSDEKFVVSKIAPGIDSPEDKKLFSDMEQEDLQRGTKEYDPDGEQFIKKFSDPTQWTYSFDESGFSYGYPIPVMADIEAVQEEVDGKEVVQVAIKTESNISTVADLIANNPQMYEGAIITLDKDIECEGILKEGEKLENIDVDKALETWTAIGSDQNPFTGTFDGEGHVISNLAILTNGSAFFGTIGEEGEVKNLTIENAVYAAEEYSAVEDDTKKEEDGYTTRWIGVLAKTNLGKLEDCLFVGDLVLPEGVDTTGIKWCLVAENDGYDKEGNKLEGEMNRCLGYFTNIDKVINDGSTKRQIIVSQNIGAGRNGGKKTKTATNGKKLKPNKTLEVNVDESFSDREIKSSYRQYTDEEMAAGEPAYWMNWNADGYTGEYKPIWKKGVAYPVKATVKNNAAVDPIVKVVYEIDGLTATEAKDANVSGDHFANVGSLLIVAYDRMPNKITVTGDGKEVNVTPGVSSATVSALPMGYVLEGNDDTKSFIVKVKLSYTSSATDVDKASKMSGVVISASGRTLTVSNAEGSELSVVDILGRAVVNQTVDSDNLSIIIPSAGVYVVRAGETTKKIVVR